MHEYMRRINKALENCVVDPGSICHASVAHDSYCNIYHGGKCNCDPEITIPTNKGLVRITKDGIVEIVS
jgi:hypothetical protein